MSFVLDIDIDTKSVEGAIDGLERALSGPGLNTFLMLYVQPALRTRAKKRFANEGDEAVGGPWAPLTPFTQRMRASQGYGPDHPINRRTGALERFITQGTNIHAFTQDSAVLVMPGTATGDLEDKLRQAQQGDPSTGSPARPVMGLDMLDMGMVLSTLNGWLVSNVEARN